MSVRIIAGKWKGRKLPVPEGLAIRPTADRVREAVFSRLQSMLGDWEGLRVADICAGSGAFGLEALSRGAAHATFVEQNRAAATAIAQTLKLLDQPGSATVLAQDARTLPAAAAPYDVLYLDPPYADGLHGPILEQLLQAQWVQDTSIIVAETQGNDSLLPAYLKDAAGRFEIVTNHRYGKTQTFVISYRQHE
mgnify:CR=1 FL=1